MPDTPQFPIFTSRLRKRPLETVDERVKRLEEWLDSFEPALQRLWTSSTFVLNAISKNDTAANRPATPELNEPFFTETDTNQTYIAVAGVWKSLGDQRDSRAFAFFMS